MDGCITLKRRIAEASRPVGMRCLLLAGMVWGAGCDSAPDQDSMVIADFREAYETEHRPKLISSAKERLESPYRAVPPPTPKAGPSGPPAGAPHGGPRQPETKGDGEKNPFRFALPENWEQRPSSRMRVVDLRFGEAGEGECYLSVLQGGGGGLTDNVNRWRTQMGLEKIADEAVAALPKKKLFGADAVYLDLEGDFTSMQSPEPKPGYRMLGLIQQQQGMTFFVKATGPKELVAGNVSNFETFAESLRIQAAKGG